MNKNLLNNNVFSKILKLNDEMNKLVEQKSNDKEEMYSLLYKAHILQGNLIKWLHTNLNKDKNTNNYFYDISVLQNLIDETKKVIYNIEGNIQYAILNNPEENNKPRFVLFHVTWCGYCRDFLPTWKKFKKININNNKIIIEDNDCTDNEEIKIKYNIKSFPTLLLINDNDIKNFEGERSIEELQKFIQ